MIHIRKINEGGSPAAGGEEWKRIASAVARYLLVTHDGIVMADRIPSLGGGKGEYATRRLNAFSHIMDTLGCSEEEAEDVIRGDYDLSVNDIVRLVGMDGFREIMSRMK